MGKPRSLGPFLAEPGGRARRRLVRAALGLRGGRSLAAAGQAAGGLTQAAARKTPELDGFGA